MSSPAIEKKIESLREKIRHHEHLYYVLDNPEITDAEFDAVADRFVAAARAMQNDGWWWSNPAQTNKSIKRAMLKEMIAHRLFPART